MTPIVVTLHMHTRNESNERSRSHWPRTRRAAAHREQARTTVFAEGRKAGVLRVSSACLNMGPCVVTMTRVSPGTLDDDGLRSALKACRDGIADAIGIDDGDPSVRWEYAQRKGPRGEHCVEVRIEAKERSE